MAVVAADMLLMYSVSAAAGDTTAGTGPTSLGDQVSTTEVVPGSLFDSVSGSEASAGDTEYRCVFVKNNHATDTAIGVGVRVQSEIASGATAALALDNIAISAKGSASAQATTVANENTAPVAVGSFGTGLLTIGDMTAGQVKGVWVRRTVTAATGGLTNDGFTLRIEGEG